MRSLTFMVQGKKRVQHIPKVQQATWCRTAHLFFPPESAPALREHESRIGGGFDRAAKPRAAAARESGVAADRLPDLADIAGGEMCKPEVSRCLDEPGF
jgi:hypothetical protein